LDAGPFGRTVAADVLGAAAERHGLTVDEAARALYADLPAERRVKSFDAPSVEELILRYDVALAQAPLLRASSMTVHLVRPSVGRVRQLLRAARFHQLIHTAQREPDGLRLDLDGPLSLFGQTSRYGVAFARFLPTVFLQDRPWSVEAEVRWPPSRALMRVDHTDGYVGQARDQGAWKTRFHTWFEERWAARDTSPWRLSDQTTPVDHGGLGVLMPDYEITDGTRTALLEIVGYWTREQLARRLDQVARVGPHNLVLAVSRRLCASEEPWEDWPGAVVPFAEVVPVPAVIEAVARVAR
jgi:predicted nuclease of restriction endonuclease-like RecB superfamily